MTDAARFQLGGLAFFLLIVIPVFFFLKRRRESDWRLVLSILGIWVIWNLIHAPVHEGSHFLGGLLVGQHAKDYRLIQHFWEGDFVNGYISWESGTRAQYRVSTLAPYAIDALMVLFGFLLLRWPNRLSPFLGALVLMVTFLRPIFDVATNYAPDTILGGAGDVRFLLWVYPRWAVHLYAWLLMLVAAGGAIFEIWKATPGTRVTPPASA